MNAKSQCLNKLASLIATFFGVGLVDKAPGTFGSLVALPLFILADCLSIGFLGNNFVIQLLSMLPIILVLFIVGTIATNYYLTDKNDDPKEVVIDEVVGQFLTCTAIAPMSLLLTPFYGKMILIIIAFILFRAFDIFKPWPINWFDQNLKGGFGVMFDDIAASISAIFTFYGLFFIYLDLTR